MTNTLSRLDRESYERILTGDGCTAVYDDNALNFQVDWYDADGQFSKSMIYEDDSKLEAAIVAHGGDVSHKL